MKIGEMADTTMSLSQRRTAKTHELQNVFSQILESVGVEGYQSAETPASTEPIDEQAQKAWDGWYELELQGRYQNADRPIELGQDFGRVINRAYQEGGYADPKGFLKSLSTDELESVQRTHWLAAPINVDGLSDEGALNLLIPPAAQVDLNRDGLTQSGAGYGFRFPDSTTPKAVADAWEESTAGLSEGDRMSYVAQMKIPTLLANIVTHPDGSFSEQIEPGDPRFKNPMAADDFSYTRTADRVIEYLDYFKNQMDPLRYLNDRSFWSDFRSRLPADA